jgi:hypothetical protein
VLDYLTVSGSSLFVTDESDGNVYKIGLREGALPGGADISVFALELATHGVVIDPSSRRPRPRSARFHTHKLYVGYASLVVQPRLAVFTANR